MQDLIKELTPGTIDTGNLVEIVGVVVIAFLISDGSISTEVGLGIITAIVLGDSAYKSIQTK